MKNSIRFISSNQYKIEEAKKILNSHKLEIVSLDLKIEELQTEDTIRLIRHKIMCAFKIVMRPLFVEHTGLYLTSMNGLPGGLTQIFWDNLGADKFTKFYGNNEQVTATAKTTLGYTDGKRIYIYEGEVKGRIAEEPRGSRDFQWDCVFIPDGFAETFAEMGEKKNEISMRRHALDKFSNFLVKGE